MIPKLETRYIWTIILPIFRYVERMLLLSCNSGKEFKYNAILRRAFYNLRRRLEARLDCVHGVHVLCESLVKV